MYIRFGKFPEDERSVITWRRVKLGKENGVSVWDCCEIHGKYRIVVPDKINENTMEDIQYFISNHNDEAYLVDGDLFGYGTDGEPVIRNVKIIKKLSKDNFEYNSIHEKLSKRYDEVLEKNPDYFDKLYKGEV